MALKDLMEEKQLNFNKPLLSVRRGSSSTPPPKNESKPDNSHPNLPPLPYYKSDLKSGPFTNPGAVPFKWECIPGRPKDENTPQKNALLIPPLTPKLPPGRTSSSRYKAELKISHSLESSSEKFLSKVKDSEKLLEDEGSTSSSEDENIPFLDARDTLSRSESFFNCSVSSMSELDFPASQGRDFMIDRFLPASKAVVSEAPLYASRRHCLAREREKPITRVVNIKKQFLQGNGIHDTGFNRIDRREVDEFDGSRDLSVKFCGLMPRFRMLNPILGMKAHVQEVSSVRNRDDKHRDEMRNNRGDLKRSAHRHTLGHINESLMNGYLGENSGRYGITRHKYSSPQRFPDKEKQFLGHPEKPTNPSNLPKNGRTKSELASHKDSEETIGLINSKEEKTLYVDYEKGLFLPKSQSSETSYPITLDNSFHDIKEGMKKRLQKNGEDLNINVKIPKQGVGNMELPEITSSTLALTPFLPKTPSESWLSRTLSSRNPTSKSLLVHHAFRASPVGLQREEPLKTSNLHMNFLSLREIAPVSEN